MGSILGDVIVRKGGSMRIRIWVFSVTILIVAGLLLSLSTTFDTLLEDSLVRGLSLTCILRLSCFGIFTKMILQEDSLAPPVLDMYLVLRP